MDNMDEIAVKRQKVEVKVESENVDPGSPHANSAINVGAGQPTIQSPSSNGAPPPPPLPQQAYWPGALRAPARKAPVTCALEGDRDMYYLCRPANGILAQRRTSCERMGPTLAGLRLAFSLSASSDLPSKSGLTANLHTTHDACTHGCCLRVITGPGCWGT
jgi:hypothetical protein